MRVPGGLDGRRHHAVAPTVVVERLASARLGAMAADRSERYDDV
jgi:hypothetical protein